MPDNIDRIVPIEASALMTTLQQTPPSARTACSAWQAHDIAAISPRAPRSMPTSSSTAYPGTASGRLGTSRSARHRFGPWIRTR